jgi:hypothetical protein
VNFFFIAIIQNMLLGAAQLPQYLLLTLTPTYSPSFKTPALGMIDYSLSAIFVLILCLEMQSDNEQQRYQAFKVKAKATVAAGGKLTAQEDGALKRGFVTSGLWSFSRHPVRIHLCSGTFLDHLSLDTMMAGADPKSSSNNRISLVNNRLGTFSTSSLSSLSSLYLPSLLPLSSLPSLPSLRYTTSWKLVKPFKVLYGIIQFGLQ